MIKTDFVEASDVEFGGDEMIFELDTDDIDSLEKIWKASIDIYSDKFRFITEIVSNAYDATVERAEMLGEDIKEFLKENPVIVKLDKDDAGMYVEIRETHGVGLSDDRIKNVYLVLNKTTKDKSLHQIGQKGIGRFSALFYTDRFFIESVYEGIKSFYTVYKYRNFTDELGNNVQKAIPKLNRTAAGILSDENNHVKFRCYIDANDSYGIANKIVSQLTFFDNVYFDNRVSNTNLDTKLEIHEHFIFIRDKSGYGEVKALLEKVPYYIDWEQVGIPAIRNSQIALRFSTSDLPVNQSREQILYNKVKRVYDREDNLVTDIDTAFENGKLKKGYRSEVFDVKDIIKSKIELFKKELYSLYEKKYIKVQSPSRFVVQIHDDFLGFSYPELIELGLPGSTYRDFPEEVSEYLKDFYRREIVYNAKSIEKGRIIKATINVRDLEEKPILFKDKKTMPQYVRDYLITNYKSAYIVNSDEFDHVRVAEEALSEVVGHYYKKDAIEALNGNISAVKTLLKGRTKEEVKRKLTAVRYILQFAKDIVEQYKGKLIPISSLNIPTVKKERNVLEKGKLVYYTPAGYVNNSRLDRKETTLEELVSFVKDLNVPVVYAAKGEIEELDVFKNADLERTIKLLILAPRYQKYLTNQISYSEFMDKPEKFDLGKEIATYYYLMNNTTDYAKILHFLKSTDQDLPVIDKVEEIIAEKRRLQEIYSVFNSEGIAKYVFEKIEENQVSVYSYWKAAIEECEDFVAKYPVIKLLNNFYQTYYYSDEVNISSDKLEILIEIFNATQI